MRNPGMVESQVGLKIAGRNINNLRNADDTILRAESEEELKSFLMNVKKESEKAGLKLNIQKTKIMASNLNTSWYTDGKKMETVANFIFLDSKKNCRVWLQPQNYKVLATWKESYDKPRKSIKKQKHHFANKGLYSQALVFPVVMYGCEI